ncbi:hypothetical protein CNBG_3075 [Cryptococcus deuterogattii R265]|uniref:uncharacterized protein n=1 Tax=Cryptococcus deuterogattii (strain R265) TaxID=294750 RepID=UPI00193788FD|nr:hypothetical protein CNBG_3075 [Cryptococcus deuterogattii R265]
MPVEANTSPRYSLQPPCGLPPLFSLPPGQPQNTEANQVDGVRRSAATTHDEGGDTLISCFGTLSISSLPLKDESTEVIGAPSARTKLYPGPKLSDRATQGPDAGPLIDRFSCLFQDQYDCMLNPKGIVSLGVAENFLMQKQCMELFSSALHNNITPLDLSYGDSLWGSRRINKALSGFFNEWFNPAEEVLPEQIITGVGCSAVLDQLFFNILDEGEAVLLAAPYYTGFDRDLISRGRVKLIPVHLSPEQTFGPESLELFEQVYNTVTAQGIAVRAVIVCNPQNPLGRTYPRETLLAYAKFCQNKDLHLVSDEIYALSIYDNKDFPEALPFTSMLSLNVQKELGIDFDRSRLHVVYGMSKDFCANGLRVGSLVSQHNPFLLRSMANTSMLMKLSSPADVIWSTLLQDKVALKKFITTNRRLLGEAQAFIRKWFEDRGVPVADHNAGNFVWVNLGAALEFDDVATEKQIFQKLLDGGVYIAPGSAYHYHIPGWYRVTFSVARDNLIIGLGRIEKLLGLRLIAP